MEADELDGMDDDGGASAFASTVRREVLTPIDGDYGVFRARLPWDLVLLLAGAPLAVFSLEAALSGDYFVKLGERVVRFLKQFDAQRRRARRGRKRYSPDRKTLEKRFGENWELVQELWPAVRWLEPVRRIAASSGLDMTLLDGLRPWKEEALLFLVTRAPHQLDFAVVQGQLEEAAKRLAGRSRRKLFPSEMEALAVEAMKENTAMQRALTYVPKGDPQAAYDHWIACVRNRMRDLASQPVILGFGRNGQKIEAARGTLRRWKREGRINKDENGKPVKRLSDIALERRAARAHRDPTGDTLNAAEAAALWGRSPRSVIAAIDKAVKDEALPKPPLLPGGGYALTRDQLPIIKKYLGTKRGPKGKRTIRIVARELGVPTAKLVRVIEAHLEWLKKEGRYATATRIIKGLKKWMGEDEEREFSVISRALEHVVKRRLAT